MKKTFSAFCLLLLSANSYSQVIKDWDKSFGASGQEFLSEVVATSDGGYLLGGVTNSGQEGDISDEPIGNYDYWIVKVNVNGNKEWDKRFGTSGYDDLTSLAQTSDGGYILGGHTNAGIDGDKSEASNGSRDYWIIKTDANGNMEWDKSFGGSSGEDLDVLIHTSDGGYLLGGESWSDASGDKTQNGWGYQDFWIVKTDASGNIEWDKTFGGTSYEYISALIQTSDGGYLLGGLSHSGSNGNKSAENKGLGDFWIVKIDENGNKEWDKSYGGSDGDGLYGLKQTNDGGFIMTGSSYSGEEFDKTEPSRGDQDGWIVKTDADGNKEWDKTLGGAGYETFVSVFQTDDNGFLIGGTSNSGQEGDKTEASLGGDDYWLVKLDAEGIKEWDKVFGGTSHETLATLMPATDGGYLLGGNSSSGAGADKSEASQGGEDIWIIRVQEGEITSLPSTLENEIVSFYSAETGLVIQDQELRNKEVTILSVSGKVMYSFNYGNAGRQSFPISVEPGMYLVKITTGTWSFTNKIVISR